MALEEFNGCSSRLDVCRKLVSNNLKAVIHVNIADPMYASPTKDRLINPSVGKAVTLVVKKLALAFFKSHPDVVAEIMDN